MQTQRKTYTLVVACGVFLALGVLTAAIGPVLPEFAANTQTRLADAGLLFTAIFLGALPSQLIAGPLGDRVGRRPVLFGAMLLLAVGTCGMLTLRSFPLLLAATVIAGLGHGGTDVSTNVLVAETFSEGNVPALNMLNVFYGVGAVAGPVLAGAAWATWRTGMPALAAGAVAIALLSPFVLRSGTRAKSPVQVRPDRNHSRAIYRSSLLWTFGLLILIYVGVENGVGGWTTTYMQRTTGQSLETAALVTSGFWLALTAGRLLAAVVGTRLSSGAILYLSLGGSLAGALLLAASMGNALVSIASLLVLGLFFGSVYPTVIAVTTQIFHTSPGKAASVVAAMGSLGGMILPWMQGVLLENLGPLASNTFVASGTCSMLLLCFGISRLLASEHRLATAGAAEAQANGR
ncbi:MAG: MFS transporter [Chloroflexi bacterium]|nr:MFS transporter [Chloroflexota bacterium]